MTATQSTVEAPEVAAAQAAGLRRLADLIEANPELAGTSSYLRSLNIWWAPNAEHLAALARAGLEHGATVEKVVRDSLYSLALRWGPVTAHALADRGNVCERVVVGVDEITRQVPDPDALAAVPLVEKVETVEKVEWRCPPLLAETATAGAR